jgi:hypothetical protein
VKELAPEMISRRTNGREELPIHSLLIYPPQIGAWADTVEDDRLPEMATNGQDKKNQSVGRQNPRAGCGSFAIPSFHPLKPLSHESLFFRLAGHVSKFLHSLARDPVCAGDSSQIRPSLTCTTSGPNISAQ